jgi:hypothetical protein
MEEAKHIFTYSDGTSIDADTLDAARMNYTDILTDEQHAFLPPLDIDEKSAQYGWEYPLDSLPLIINDQPNYDMVDILKKVVDLEKNVAAIKSDLDEIKEAIMAINRKMDSY